MTTLRGPLGAPRPPRPEGRSVGDPTVVTPATPSLTPTGTSPASSANRFEGTKSVVAKGPASLPAALASSLFDAPVEQQRLPSLEAALVDPAIAPLSPATLDVPKEVLAMLQGARRVLVVGHVPPDGDCVGASLGLARALRAMGKEADACVDAELPGRIRAVNDLGDLKRAAEVQDGGYDLVVLVDVAQGKRTGGVNKLIESAPNVLILDHHHATGDREEAGAKGAQRFASWIRPDLDAATLMVAGAVEQLEGVSGRRIAPEAWADVAAPLAAGVITDTDSFRSPGADLDALRMCKDLLTRRLGGDLDGVQARLDYEFPLAGVEALKADSAGGAAEGVRVRRLTAAGETLLSVPRGAFAHALDAARGANDKTAESDVTGHLLDRLDGVMARSEVGILAIEGPAGVQVSVRSRSPDIARQLVEELFPGRGGGKPHAAAARPEGGLVEVERQLEGWFRRRELQRELKLRAGAF